MPPCGSPLNSTTNSVPLPVSWLNASSVTIREDRGIMLPMRSNASCGMLIRSSAAFALPGSVGSGSASRPLFARAPSCGSIVALGGRPPRNETALHRKLTSSVERSMAVKTCVPIGRSGSAIVTGVSRMGLNA